MADKFQILVSPDKKYAVIMRADTISGKERWNIYIPDAGDQFVATRICRLLNAEHEADQTRRAQREQEVSND